MSSYFINVIILFSYFILLPYYIRIPSINKYTLNHIQYNTNIYNQSNNYIPYYHSNHFLFIHLLYDNRIQMFINNSITGDINILGSNFIFPKGITYLTVYLGDKIIFYSSTCDETQINGTNIININDNNNVTNFFNGYLTNIAQMFYS